MYEQANCRDFARLTILLLQHSFLGVRGIGTPLKNPFQNQSGAGRRPSLHQRTALLVQGGNEFHPQGKDSQDYGDKSLPLHQLSTLQTPASNRHIQLPKTLLLNNPTVHTNQTNTRIPRVQISVCLIVRQGCPHAVLAYPVCEAL